MIDLILKNCKLQNRNGVFDIAIKDSVIDSIDQIIDVPSFQIIDLQGRLVVPGFVDPHVHLDIALMNPWEEPGRRLPFRKMSDLNTAIEAGRLEFTFEDIVNRASAALELAVQHGVTAIRAQCHIDPQIGLKHFEALKLVKERYAGIITLQIVGFPQQGFSRKPGTLELYRKAFEAGLDVMGGASNLDYDSSGYVDFKKHIDIAFDLAREFDVDLDIHADLAIPETVTLDSLELVYIAGKTIETNYQGRVTIGHACALDSASPEVAQKAIELLREANISVISQPDLYRLGREDKQHVRRGLTRVKELLSSGVNVAFASNNVRDALRPMGNFNPIEEALILSYGAHMDTNEQFTTLMEMCTYNAARAINLKNYGVAIGKNADLVVLNATTPSGAIIGQVEQSYVFKSGRLMAVNELVRKSFHSDTLRTTKESQ